MWTEITKDNEDLVYDMVDKGTPVLISYRDDFDKGVVYYSTVDKMFLSIHTMAKYGGYWYYAVPANLQCLDK